MVALTLAQGVHPDNGSGEQWKEEGHGKGREPGGLEMALAIRPPIGK